MTDFLSMAASLAEDQDGKDLPVEQWHPAHCGSMDLLIRIDGSWVHEGTPIGRPALIRLFSKVLRKDGETYVLVTPAEKLEITVEDVPFVAVDVERKEDDLLIRTNVGDIVHIGPDHPLTLRPGPDGQLLPYVLVRGGLLARFGRSAYYRLVEMADLAENRLSVTSGGMRYDLGAVS